MEKRVYYTKRKDRRKLKNSTAAMLRFYGEVKTHNSHKISKGKRTNNKNTLKRDIHEVGDKACAYTFSETPCARMDIILKREATKLINQEKENV